MLLRSLSVLRSRAQGRASTLALTLTLGACAHAAAPVCPATASSPVAATFVPPPGLGFVAARSLDTPEPLALYDLKWLLMMGDSGALTELPLGLHSFTLGRWECALGAEKSRDALAAGQAEVRRSRKLACTHGTGITMQTELACGYSMPAAVSEGAPRLARRAVRVELADAPALSLSCEPAQVQRLPLVQGERKVLAEVCLAAGRVETCPVAK